MSDTPAQLPDIKWEDMPDPDEDATYRSRMQSCYGLSLGTHRMAVADLISPGELTPGWTITRLHVPTAFRGNGHGSALLNLVLADADKLNVRLYVEPFSSGPLDHDALVAWYQRHGFVKWRYGYLRRPANTNPNLGAQQS